MPGGLLLSLSLPLSLSLVLAPRWRNPLLGCPAVRGHFDLRYPVGMQASGHVPVKRQAGGYGVRACEKEGYSTGIGTTHTHQINPPVLCRTTSRVATVPFCIDRTVELLQEVKRVFGGEHEGGGGGILGNVLE